MSRLVITEASPEKLRSLTSPVELVDETGCVIGRYIPVNQGMQEPPLSPEELERRLNEPGRPLAEILNDLEGRV